jgi:pyruvate,orthophosphate dikinase
MMLASALVIDIGGAISHGAIIARELGIPCVIGTRNGTAHIRTGDRLRVDGANGVVHVIERSDVVIKIEARTDTTTDKEPRSDNHMENQELAILRALRLKGRASPQELATASGVSEREVAWILTDLVEAGGAREVNGSYMLLPPARERLNVLLEEEREGVDADAVNELYEAFAAVNQDFKQLATDWQTRDGEPNEHADAAYDQQVLDRLPPIHERVAPIVDGVAVLAPRLAPYRSRLENALERVRAGEHAWLLKPLIDSYHTVWFELHEELIALAGLSREAEAASGRAE